MITAQRLKLSFDLAAAYCVEAQQVIDDTVKVIMASQGRLNEHSIQHRQKFDVSWDLNAHITEIINKHMHQVAERLGEAFPKALEPWEARQELIERCMSYNHLITPNYASTISRPFLAAK